MSSLHRNEMFDRNDREREQKVAELQWDLEQQNKLIVAYLNQQDGAKHILEVAELAATHLTTHEEGQCAWEKHYKLLLQELHKIIK